MPDRYTKRPVTIEAMQFTGDNTADVMAWLGEHRGPQMWEPATEHTPERISILTLEGEMQANVGDWIIRGVKGEFYPCKPDVFEATYFPASDGGGRAGTPVVPGPGVSIGAV